MEDINLKIDANKNKRFRKGDLIVMFGEGIDNQGNDLKFVITDKEVIALLHQEKPYDTFIEVTGIFENAYGNKVFHLNDFTLPETCTKDDSTNSDPEQAVKLNDENTDNSQECTESDLDNSKLINVKFVPIVNSEFKPEGFYYKGVQTLDDFLNSQAVNDTVCATKFF